MTYNLIELLSVKEAYVYNENNEHVTVLMEIRNARLAELY